MAYSIVKFRDNEETDPGLLDFLLARDRYLVIPIEEYGTDEINKWVASWGDE